jgi:integrase
MTNNTRKPKPRHANRLTVKKIARLHPGKYVDGGGLALIVSAIGTKSWVFRFERAGRDRAMVLDKLHENGGATEIPRDQRRGLTIDEARAEAAKAMALLRAGIDPIDARDELKKANEQNKLLQIAEAAKIKTFEAAAQEYFDAYSSHWKNASYRAKFMSSLRCYAFPKIGALPVGAIDTPLVIEVIEPIGKAGKAPTADRVRGRIENVLDFCKARGYRTGDNPAALDVIKYAKLPPKPKVRHFVAMPFVRVPNFVSELSQSSNIAAKALEFLILNAARSKEVIQARWSEFELRSVEVIVPDEDGQEWPVRGPFWTVPPDKMKEKKEHRVPLDARSVVILQKLRKQNPRDDSFVFNRNGKRLGKNSFYKTLETMKQEVTTHGFRTSFRTWAGNETDFPVDVCEVAIAHSVGEKMATYQRGDLLQRRRKLMEAWARYCLTPKGDASVTDIGAARKRRR